MKICGIDPSSSCCGVALAVDGALVRTDAWERPKDGSAPARLLAYFDWLTGWLLIHTPDMAVIEFLSVERNAQTTRVVSHYQAVSALACKRQGLVVIEARVKTARKAALGNGGLSKEEAFAAMRAKCTEHDFGRWNAKKNGGPAGDKADAAVLALAGPSVAEAA